MFDIVLYRPEIPPNAGNVIRLAANTGARLHLVEPLGFSMDDKQLKRAGLDYHEYASVRVHADWKSCLETLGNQRLFALTTRGETNAFEVSFQFPDLIPQQRGFFKLGDHLSVTKEVVLTALIF